MASGERGRGEEGGGKGAGSGERGAGGGGGLGGCGRRGLFLRGLAARKPGRVFSALAHRGRPLADTSPARAVREAPSSENPRPVFAWSSAKPRKKSPGATSCGQRALKAEQEKARWGFRFRVGLRQAMERKALAPRPADGGAGAIRDRVCGGSRGRGRGRNWRRNGPGGIARAGSNSLCRHGLFCRRSKWG